MAERGRLLIFDTHPIAYRSPVFRALYQIHGDLKVYFFNSGFDATEWWFHESGKNMSRTGGAELTEGFPNETLETEKLGFRRTLKALRRVLEAERPSAVLIYGYYLPDQWALRWLTARLGIPLLFVGETFNSTSGLTRRLMRPPLRKYFFRGVSRFIAIGEKTASFYKAQGIPDKQIDQARYCADVAYFDRPKEEAKRIRAEWRRAHSIEDDAFVVLYVGRLFERKRPMDAVALHSMLSDRPEVHTVIVGYGPMEPKVRAAAERLPRIHVLGFQSHEQLIAIYHGADLLFVPSEYETWGLVVNEASVAGTPALITDSCGVAGDLVVPGKTGFIYPMGVLPEAARLVRAALNDRKRLGQIAEAARQKVGGEYRADQFAEVVRNSFIEAARSGRR